MTIDHVAFGIIVDDIVFPQGYTCMGVLGGGGPQTAWGMAAASDSGTTVGLVAGTGVDITDDILAPMHDAHINLDGLRVTSQPTPRAWQVIEFNGRRTQVWRVPLPVLGAQLVRSWDVLPPHYRAAHSFHWGIHPGDDGSLAFAHQLKAKDRLVSLEPFKPPAHPLAESDSRAILSACDVFSPNWVEATTMLGITEYTALVARFRALGCRILTLRRGADGADIWHFEQGRGLHVPAVETEVVDVVGAGNTFCGAFIAQLDDGLETAACHASVAAAYMIEQTGLPPALPDPVEYARRLATVRAGIQPLALD